MKNLIYLSLLIIFAVASSCTKEEEVYTGSIQGIVTVSGTNNPLSGVQVSIVNTGTSTTTGSDGQFMFTNLEAKSYRLQFTKDGYNTNTRSVTVIAGESANCDTQLTPESQDAEISISPSTLNFGTTQDQLTVTISNNGNAATEWSLDLANNNWLSASPMSGNIQSGKTQSIIFSVDRSLLSEPKSAKVNLSAFGNSYTISVSCAPRNAQSEMTVTPTTLNFGGTLSEQSLTIQNTGDATLTWNISGITESCIVPSATSGNVEAGGSKVIKVTLDRTALTTDLNTSFVISDGIKEQIINVTASTDPTDDPNNPDNPGGDTDPSGTVVTSGLYTYYKFDGDFTDSQNGIDGYGTNSPEFVEGVDGVGQAIKFSRTDESAFVVGQSIMDGTEMSVSFWGKDFADGHIFHTVSSEGNEPMLMFSMMSGKLYFGLTDYYESSGVSLTHTNISNANWHHVVLNLDYGISSRNTMTITLYVDGMLMGTTTINSMYYDDDYMGTGIMFTIGGSCSYYGGNLNATNMTIDNFRVYDTRRLTAQEVKEIYNAKQ